MALISLIILSIYSISVHSQRTKRCQDKAECESLDIISGKIECGGQQSCRYGTLTARRGYVQCGGSQSCQDVTSINAAKNIFCEGYQGCYSSEATALNIQCSGSKSCEASSSMTATASIYGGGYYSMFGIPITSGQSTNCMGSTSCYRSNINADGDVKCESENACNDATISTAGNLLCTGQESCGNARITAGESVQIQTKSSKFVITNTPLIEVFAAGVKKGSIDSGTLSAMTVKMFADQTSTTQLSQIICRTGAECQLHCKAQGCISLNYQCESGAVCKVNPVECETNSGLTIDGVICPNITTITAMNEKQSGHQFHDHDIPETEDITDNVLKSEVNKVCDLQRECLGESINSTGGSVYCGGLNSCLNAEINTDSSIFCMGEDSCNSAQSISATSSSSRVQCYGSGSCASSQSITASTNDIYLNTDCFGFESCHNVANIHSTSQILCDADSSCSQSSISTTGDTIWCRGYKACQGSDITVATYTYCLGSYSCSNANINKYGAICRAYHSCSGSVLDSGGISGNTWFFIGGLSGFNSTIYSGYVSGSGYRAIAYAMMDFDNSGSTDFAKVNIDGHQAGIGATYICRSGSQCKLICSNTACNNLDYICESGATCSVTPRQCFPGTTMYEGVVCPNRLSTENKEETQAFLDRKQMDRENEDEYKQIVAKMMMDREEYLLALQIDFDDEEDVDDELLFGEGNKVDSMEWKVSNDSVVILGVFVALTVFAVLYGWNKMNCGQYETLK